MWTDDEMDEVLRAINIQDMAAVTRLMNIYQQRMPNDNDVISDIKASPHFLLAFYIGFDKLIEFYLAKSPELIRIVPYINCPQSIEGWSKTDIVTLNQLYSGFEIIVSQGQKDIADLLLTKYKFDPNFILPMEYSFYFRRTPELKSAQYPLLYRISSNEQMLQFLLTPKYKVQVDLDWQFETIVGITTLFQLVITQKYRLAQLLL